MPTRFLFEVLVNHQWVPVLLGRSGRQVVVELPGRHVTVDVVELSEATYSLLIDGRSYDVTVGVAEKEYQVSVNGSQFDVCLRDPRKFRKQTASGSDSAGPMPVAAPMPGKIVKLLVREGETVSRRSRGDCHRSHENAKRVESSQGRDGGRDSRHRESSGQRRRELAGRKVKVSDTPQRNAVKA